MFETLVTSTWSAAHEQTKLLNTFWLLFIDATLIHTSPTSPITSHLPHLFHLSNYTHPSSTSPSSPTNPSHPPHLRPWTFMALLLLLSWPPGLPAFPRAPPSSWIIWSQVFTKHSLVSTGPLNWRLNQAGQPKVLCVQDQMGLMVRGDPCTDEDFFWGVKFWWIDVHMYICIK